MQDKSKENTNYPLNSEDIATLAKAGYIFCDSSGLAMKDPLPLLTPRPVYGLDMVIKCINWTDREMKMFKHLTSSKTEENHIVNLLAYIPFTRPALVRLNLVAPIIDSCSAAEIQATYRQFLRGVGYLHQRKLAYLGWKPDNIVIDKRASSSPLRSVFIVDFDRALVKDDGGTMRDEEVYGPMRVDRGWVGKVVSFFLGLIKDKNELDLLAVSLSESLSPELRPARHVFAEHDDDAQGKRDQVVSKGVKRTHDGTAVA